MQKMIKKMKDAPIDKAVDAEKSGDVDSDDFVVIDRKINVFVEEVPVDKTVGEEDKSSRGASSSPPGKVRAALRKFMYTGKQEEETYEQWKQKKLTKKPSEKRKAVVEEETGTRERNTITGTPSKLRKVVVPGKIHSLNSKINITNTSPSLIGGGGQVQLARVGPGGVGGGILGAGGQVKLARKDRGGVGDAVLDGGANYSPNTTQQRDRVGKVFTLRQEYIAAAVVGEKTSSGDTADSTDVQ